MNKVNKTIIGSLLLILLFVFSCQKKEGNKDTITEGKATLYVDESILPIVEEEQAVFETEYAAKLHLVPQSEKEIMNAMVNDSAKMAILTRELTPAEAKAFEAKKIIPKIIPIANDAIAFIRNKTSNDTLVALQDIIDFINGKPVANIKGLVFDNANSSTVRYMNKVTGATIEKQKNIYSFKTNQDVIKYVADNDGMIGVVGMNWVYQPPLDLEETVDKVNILAVKSITGAEYVFPSQDNLAAGKYPLARRLYMINCQGYSGLGMGFTSFIGSERGQRIILKSGLVPERFPTRKIVIRNKITKDKN
jgi:phosphate transport system substrate-binding protein